MPQTEKDTLRKDVVRTGRKFDQVLQGAREVFMADGFSAASVDDIARAAGVSKATLYSYFLTSGYCLSRSLAMLVGVRQRLRLTLQTLTLHLATC